MKPTIKFEVEDTSSKSTRCSLFGITFKLISALYITAVLIYELNRTTPKVEFCFKLCYWAHITELMYFLYSVSLELVSLFHDEDLFYEIPAAMQTLADITISFQTVADSYFWLGAYFYLPHRFVLWEIYLHAVGWVLIIIAVWYDRCGFSMNSALPVFVFGFLYTISHIAYVFAVGHPVYPVLTFDNAFSYYAAICGCVFTQLTLIIAAWIADWLKAATPLKHAFHPSVSFPYSVKAFQEAVITPLTLVIDPESRFGGANLINPLAVVSPRNGDTRLHFD